MASDHIPRPDAEFLRWLMLLQQGVDALGEKLTAEDRQRLASLPELVEQVQAAMQANDLAHAQAKTAKVAKDLVRRRNEKAVRYLVRYLQSCRQLSDTDRAQLAIHVPKRTRMRAEAARQAPLTAPVLEVVAQGAIHRIFARDPKAPLRRAKPPRVLCCRLDRVILPPGQAPPAEEDLAWREVGMYGRLPVRVGYEGGYAGMRAWYRGCWMNPARVPGPWSSTVSAIIMG